MNKLKILGITSACFLMSLTASFGEDPQKELQATVDEVIQILYDRNSPLQQRQNRLQNALEDRFSFEVISQRSMGRNWDSLSESEKDRFTDLFSELLIQSYTSGLEGETLGNPPAINWAGQRELRKGLIEIQSEVTLDKQTYPIRYRMARLQNGWQVYDVLVEGVSLVGNYRKQFTSILQRGNSAELFQTLEEKVRQNRDKNRQQVE